MKPSRPVRSRLQQVIDSLSAILDDGRLEAATQQRKRRRWTPSIPAIDEASSMARVDRMMAVAHLPLTAHVALIGHHTLLLLLLALLQRGCAAVRSLRPGAPSPDCEATDLAWVVDVQGDGELDGALRAARSRVGATGRVIVEGATCVCRDGLKSIRNRAVAVGLDVISFDHTARRLVLGMRPRLMMAA